MVSENWPCVFYNYETNMLLIVYVDDMKLAGPNDKMEQTWKDLGKRIKLEIPRGDSQEEKPDGSSQMTFLGCTLRRKKRTVRGKEVTMVEYDVEDSFQCLKCAPGCESCDDYSPCIASLNWVLRTILLVLQCIIIASLSIVVLLSTYMLFLNISH